MRSINGMAERFREMLKEDKGITLAGCYDALSAAILEHVGFDCVFLSGYGVAASLFSNPDIGLTSLTETANSCKNITSALNIPVVVDADNGYGNEDNVSRTVFELEHAGAAAMIMEDQIFPKRCGHEAKKEVVPFKHYMKKLEIALRVRKTPMVIIARTDSMDLDDAISRATACYEAGADATLIDGVKSLDAAKRICEEVPGPKQLNLIYGGKTEILKTQEFFDMGYKIVLYSTPALYTASATLFEKMKLLKETGDLSSISNESTTFSDFQNFVTQRYLRRISSGSNE